MDTKLIINMWKHLYYKDSKDEVLKEIEMLLLLIEQMIIHISKKSLTPRQDYKELREEYKIIVKLYNKTLQKYNNLINNSKK